MSFWKNQKVFTWQSLFISFLLLLITGFILFFMGRQVICTCGTIKLWHGIVMSPENSQQITDFYTFSHIIHGFVFYYILKILTRKRKTHLSILVVIAIVIEAAWEIFENTDMTINRYRQTTISLDYYGDTIINSLSDILAMIGGFWLSAKLPGKFILLLTLLMEIATLVLIRDNLILNVIMPLFHIEAIKTWQMGK